MAITTNTFVIRDTGYLLSDETGTIETNIANSGNEILVPVRGQTFNFNATLDSKPSAGFTRKDSTKIGVYTAPITSVSNPTIVVNCRYDLSDSDQRSALKSLERAIRTLGVKEYYYKDDNDGAHAGRKFNLIDVFGETDDQESTYKHLHVMIRQMQVPETANKMGFINFQMTLEVIK